MPAKHRNRALPFGLAALAALLIAAPTAGAAPATYKGASADGEVVFFETEEQLVPGDTDSKRDVYGRSFDEGVGDFVTREISLGPAGGTDAYPATYEGASDDGTRVFFSTDESLAEADTDHRADVYMRDLPTGTTTLVTRGEAGCPPGCGNGAFDATFARTSADGERVFFVTDERLVAADSDTSYDVHVRDLETETTSLVSAGGSGPFDASLRGISPEGDWAYFTTAESLLPADGDEAVDVYARDVGAETTALVSRGEEGCPACGDSGAVPIFQGNSDDGARVFFSTDEVLLPADEDTATDVYSRDLPGGPTRLLSGGAPTALTASFAAATGDGTHVFFTTAESLVSEDEDGANDIYESSGGTIELVTSAECSSACGATFDAVSEDAETVVFSTEEQLVALDEDEGIDIYEQEVGGGAPVLVSRADPGCAGCGDGAFDARFNRASADVSHVAFTSAEQLSTEDPDSEDDIYARDVLGSTTSLITTSPSYCPLKKGNCGATFADVSVDGQRIFFTSFERFTLVDGDNEVDVYERLLGESPAEDTTRLVSTGNSPDLELGPGAPVLEGTDPPSPAASTAPKVLGHAQAGSTVKLYSSPTCSGEPVAHALAAQLEAPGIGVTVAADSTTAFHATAESEGFVSTCSGAITYVQQSGGSGGGGGGEGGGGPGGGGSGGGAGLGDLGIPAGPGGPPGAAHVSPHTRITFAPASKTRSRNPIFRFVDSTGQSGTRFRCKLDSGRWKGCRSPLKLKKVGRGRHVLKVRAVNARGVWESVPVTRRFKVVPR
jgi:Tol biopolymer transport system component